MPLAGAWVVCYNPRPMAASKAKTVGEYLRELDPERRAILTKVRKVVNDNLPKGYKEGMGYGMISWQIPLSAHPGTSDGQPLSYAALAAQKNYNALYLNCVYISEERTRRLAEAFAEAGLKLDMGKSCIRFRTADDLALDVIAREIASTAPAEFAAASAQARQSSS